MKQDILISVFGTFGNPNGFNQRLSNRLFPVKTFDIKTSAIQLFPNTKMYGLRKEKIDEQNIISYTIYTYAQERSSTRGGTFVGSSVLGVNGSFKEQECLEALQTFHKEWISNPRNIQGGNIMVRHSSEIILGNTNVFSPLFKRIKSIEDIDFRERGNELLVYDEMLDNRLVDYFEKGLEILSLYDKIYFTNSQEIAEYTNRKGLITVFDRECFNKSLYKVTEQRRKECIRIQREVVSWSENIIKQKKINESIVKEAKEVHRKNEELIRKIENEQREIDNLIKPVFDNVKSLINRLSSSIDDVPKYSQINKIKEQIKQEKQKLNYKLNPESQDIKRIYDNRSKIRVEEEENSQSPKRSSGPKSPIFIKNDYLDEQENSNKLKLVIVVIIFLLISFLLGCCVGYEFYRWRRDSKEPKEKKQEQVITLKNQIVTENINKVKLEPLPNSVLSEKDKRMIVDKISKEKLPMHIDKVVKIIFEKNPNDIGKIYEGQREEYGEYLKEKNPKVFNGEDRLISPDFKEIPAYKKK